MAGAIVRLLAEKDMRALAVAASAQSPEGVGKTFDRLEIEMAGPAKQDDPLTAERDEKGFSELKALAAAM